jgi:hypothetical protein
VSDFYGISPELHEAILRQLEPTMRILRDAAPALMYTQRLQELVRPHLAGVAVVEKLAAEAASMFISASDFGHATESARVLTSADQVITPQQQAKVRVTRAKPKTGSTLPVQFAALPCGQRLGLMVIGLSLLLYLDLPPEVQNQIVGLIGVISAAIWLSGRISKKQQP